MRCRKCDHGFCWKCMQPHDHTLNHPCGFWEDGVQVDQANQNLINQIAQEQPVVNNEANDHGIIIPDHADEILGLPPMQPAPVQVPVQRPHNIFDPLVEMPDINPDQINEEMRLRIQQRAQQVQQEFAQRIQQEEDDENDGEGLEYVD